MFINFGLNSYYLLFPCSRSTEREPFKIGSLYLLLLLPMDQCTAIVFLSRFPGTNS